MSATSDNFKTTVEKDLQLRAPYKKGDLIGQEYEVYGVLGKGGCGVVYLVYSHKNGGVYALKTFRDEFLTDPETRLRFRREAGIWVELGRHPYLVHAYFVDEISGRLYIAMEHISPNEAGLNSLEGYLQKQPPDLAQSLRWAIQICHGME
jgi:serine/threonine protein kinase